MGLGNLFSFSEQGIGEERGAGGGVGGGGGKQGDLSQHLQLLSLKRRTPHSQCRKLALH